MSELDRVYTALDPRLAAVEAVREGYLLHYALGERLRVEDEDLRLLAGDAFYALGVARLAEAGDLDAVARLADLITGCAKAHAEGEPGRAAALWANLAR
jgi:hypothetical protein